MPLAEENATAVVRKAPPAAMIQPVRASVRRSRVSTASARAPPPPLATPDEERLIAKGWTPYTLSNPSR